MFESGSCRLGVGGLLLLILGAASPPGGLGAAPHLRRMSGMHRAPCRTGAHESLAYIGGVGGVSSGGLGEFRDCLVNRSAHVRHALRVAMGLDDRPAGQGRGLKNVQKARSRTSLDSAGYAFPAPSESSRPRRAHGKPFHVPPQAVLLVVALTAFVSVLGLGGSAEGFASVSSWLSSDSIISNVPTCALCFGLPDLLAQLLVDKGREIDMRQVFSAACIGIVMNAVGFEMWLHYLEITFPSDVVGFGSGFHGVLLLLLKSLADSLVWGTASNTAVLIGKRKMAGDSWQGAGEVWMDTIMEVTKTEFKFWPIWQAINFCFMPKVAFMSLGELTWNSFLCITASRVGNPTTGHH